jgi:hypothetical protein
MQEGWGLEPSLFRLASATGVSCRRGLVLNYCRGKKNEVELNTALVGTAADALTDSDGRSESDAVNPLRSAPHTGNSERLRDARSATCNEPVK